MVGATFGVRIFSDNVAEWQINAVKKYATKQKEEEIEHSALTPAGKKNQLYEALSHVESREDEEFPIAGPSFNKYFRNPDFCNEEKWTEAAKVLKAVRKDYMEGE